jgi:hypothetical protein
MTMGRVGQDSAVAGDGREMAATAAALASRDSNQSGQRMAIFEGMARSTTS